MNLLCTSDQGRPRDLIILKIQNTDDQEFKIFFEEKRKGAETTVQQYIPAKIPLSSLNSLSQEIYSILYKSTNEPENSTENTEQSLEQVGHELFNLIFPIQIKENLASSDLRNLCITIDQSLIGIPWELLFDGEEFFCLRFNMGRIVYTSHSTIKTKIPDLKKLHMLILADPKKDLPKSYKEGEGLYRKLENWSDSLDVTLLTSHIDIQTISRRIFEGNILHYAGHAEYNTDNPGESGWLLKDGIFTAKKIKQLAGSKKAFPALVFSNACRSGQTSEWSKKQSDHQGIYHAFDLVDAFLLSGVQHYIGTFQEVRDLSSLSFALSFYGFMLQSYTIGEALRKARIKLKGESEKNSNNLIWAYYVLYGDPMFNYFGQKTLQEPEEAEQVIKGDQGQEIEHNENDVSGFQKENTRSGQKDLEKEGSESFTKKRFPFHMGFPLQIAISLLIIFLVLVGTVSILRLWNTSPKPSQTILRIPTRESNLPLFQDPFSDRDKNERIRNLIEYLGNKSRVKKKDEIPGIEDGWSSRPFSLAVFGYLSKDNAGLRNNMRLQRLNELIARHIDVAIKDQSSISLVDRRHLEEILMEHQLTLSDLAHDKQSLVKFGKIHGARILLFSELLPQPFNHKYEIDLNIIDTETTKKIPFMFQLEKEDDYKYAAGEIAKIAVNKIGILCPMKKLKGRITSVVENNKVRLNIGLLVGLQLGYIMDVQGERDRNEPQVIGKIEIIEIDDYGAMAKVLEKKRPFTKGDRVYLLR